MKTSTAGGSACPTLLAVLQGLVLLAWPVLPVIAIGVWWNSNTISHHFIHRPFFRSRLLNLIFSAYLSVLLGIPQALWRDRHLAHHAGVEWRLRLTGRLIFEMALVVGFWTILAVYEPRFFVAAYLPGYLIGLGLCAVQGYYEHARGATSHYGSIYNFLFFNDGYHVEHHAYPRLHWTQLPDRVERSTNGSAWPAVLRWLEDLERVVLRFRWLQRWVLGSHRKAFAGLMPQLGTVRRVAIVGGGLFPRTALILRELLPQVEIVIIDLNRRNLEAAREFLDSDIRFVNQPYREPDGCDLVVIPLSFSGDRARFYDHPPARAVLVHDWIWRPRGTSRVISRVLLKRLNLVTQ